MNGNKKKVGSLLTIGAVVLIGLAILSSYQLVLAALGCAVVAVVILNKEDKISDVGNSIKEVFSSEDDEDDEEEEAIDE